MRIELLAPATVQWTTDNWTTTHDARTADTTLGMQIADLPTDKLSVGTEVAFAFFWLEASHWEGTNFVVGVTGPNPSWRL